MIGNQTPFLLSTPAHNERETCRAQAETEEGRLRPQEPMTTVRGWTSAALPPTAWTVLSKVHHTHTLTIRSDNHSPGRVTYRSEPHIFTKLYILLLIAIASVITKHWIQSKCPSMLRECMGRYLVCWNSWMLANELVLGFSGKTGGKVRAIRTSSEDLSLYSRIQRMAVKAKLMTNISVFEGS